MSDYSKALWHPFANPSEVDASEPIHIVSGDGVYVKENVASARTIVRCGGELEDEEFMPDHGAVISRYWINL